MAKPSSGILRRPRYSSASIKANESGGDDDDVVPSIASPPLDVTPTSYGDTAMASNNKDVIERHADNSNRNQPSPQNSNKVVRQAKKNTRSLADLVKSSVSLNNEAYGMTEEKDEGAGVPGKIIQKSQESDDLVSGEEKFQDLSLDDARGNNIIEGAADLTTSSLAIDDTVNVASGSGQPVVYIDSADYKVVLNENEERILLQETDVASASADVVVANKKDGDNSHHVRFHENEDGDNTEEETNIDSTSSRARLEQKITGPEVDFDFDDEVQNDANEDEKKEHFSDTDSNSSGGSAEDDEILAELGLSELIPTVCPQDPDDENDDLSISSGEDHYFEERAEEEPELRAFRVLWEVLSRWATPSSIELVRQYQNEYKHIGQRNNATREAPTSSTNASKVLSPNNGSTRNSVDVGASRRAGIMSMLKMNVARSLSELKKIHKMHSQQHLQSLSSVPVKPASRKVGSKGSSSAQSKIKEAIVVEPDNILPSSHELNLRASQEMKLIGQRDIEQRLADLIKAFDSTGHVANLNTKMWRGMTTILIVIAFPVMGIPLDAEMDGVTRDQSNGKSSDEMLPVSVRLLGMTVDEYRYLTQSALLSLGSTK